jgi:hypothetical protein
MCVYLYITLDFDSESTKLLCFLCCDDVVFLVRLFDASNSFSDAEDVVVSVRLQEEFLICNLA